MAHAPKVSVIVPVYNSEVTIEECLQSLLKLNYPREDVEFIIVNNASTDRTADIIDSYREKISMLNEEKKGPSAARNKGIMSASGKFVAFTDSDCVVDKDWLKYIIPPLQDDSIGIVGGKILAKHPCNNIEEFGEKIHDHNKAINEFKPPYVITMNWASKLSVLKEVGLFDESFLRVQDGDLSYRILQAGYKIIYRSEAIVYHSNEKTLSGLFHKGYLHGFHSVRVVKKHKIFLRQFGHGRFYLNSYIEILSSLINYMLGKNRSYSICYFTFNIGKKVGKIFGSIRFSYFEV